ncbi:hypothetical protein TSOC_001883 [Tetrabaena socialis]|uniref:phytol kinase n=1 Tax=Tetrabaena socialis TaxID=47790 RepID=A0A2J8AFG1_9CHLO|nr:hypothetical protein TSOC_001883 [Tetrabaena socialis]|eukprot:PNH11260.1 hypothetical protein TSOC_001883 [Tetrabaena socialis]
MVGAALEAGLLPCLERLLRRAGETPEACEALLTRHLLRSECFDLELLAPLLAYGEPRQAASLVATVGKLLASLAVPDVVLVKRADRADHGGRIVEAAYLASHLLVAVQLWLLAGARSPAGWQAQPAPCGPSGEQAAAAVAVAPGRSVQRQLAAAVSCSVGKWLPPLSRLFQATPHFMQVCGGAASALAATVSNCLRSLLAWVPTLSRCGVEEGASAAAGGWQRWLLQEARVVPLLGAALGLLPVLLLQEREEQLGQAAEEHGCELVQLLGESCCCVAAAFPNEVRDAALAAAAAEESSANGGSGASGGSGAGARSSGWRAGDRSTRAGVSRNSSTSGHAQPADWAAAVAAASGSDGWRPSLLRDLAAELRAHGSSVATTAAAVEDLAGQLEACRAGGSSGDASVGWQGLPSLPVQDSGSGAGALLLLAPVEACALLRTCANPACDNLAGDSEAELPLRACGRCGAAWYCRPECQTAHWRAGHRQACRLPRG